MSAKEDKKTASEKKIGSSIKQKGFWKKFAEKYWYAPDLPQGEPIFQPKVFSKWCGIYIGLPLAGFALALMFVKVSEGSKGGNTVTRSSDFKLDASRSQIIDFRITTSSGEYSAYVKRAPGTLVRVKLLNSVEGTGNAPVHAQILDGALGRNLMGGTLLGEAAGDQNLDRVTITFNYARDPSRMNIPIPIRARALAKDGTLGLNGTKKEGMLARTALGAGSKLTQDAQGAVDSFDIRQIFMKAISSGFLNEAGNELGVERNRAALLVLKPNTEFFAELIDYFPGSAK
ncbi:MAG: hypothetical protein R3A80_09955 [Bdellovibrionota bacterium]